MMMRSGLVLLLAGVAFSQTAAAASFEVVSVKLSDAEFGSYFRYLPGGRLSAMSWIKQVIQIAYGVENYQVVDGPAWLADGRYVIEAKAADPNAGKAEINAMLQTLLADRFRLKVRHEMREFSVFDLVADKEGVRIRPMEEGQRSKCGRDNSFVCGTRTFAQLADSLKYIIGKPVFDKTGHEEKYDLLLDFDVFSVQGKNPPENYSKPSLTTALHEQLGVRLEPRKVSLPVYIVESVQRPSEN